MSCVSYPLRKSSERFKAVFEDESILDEMPNL